MLSFKQTANCIIYNQFMSVPYVYIIVIVVLGHGAVWHHTTELPERSGAVQG